jgi:hypothetical protein
MPKRLCEDCLNCDLCIFSEQMIENSNSECNNFASNHDIDAICTEVWYEMSNYRYVDSLLNYLEDIVN